MIQPIETSYKGFRFRSRLEARWAVFFDALGIRWEYEPEGFILPDGRPYLPDFRIFDSAGAPFFVEVKRPGGDMSKPRGLALAGALVVLLEGQPGNQVVPLYFPGEDTDPCPAFWTTDGLVFNGSQAFQPNSTFAPSWTVREAIERARGARFEFGERPL